MNKQLQEAQEIEEGFNFYTHISLSKYPSDNCLDLINRYKEQAKANVEKLGCGKKSTQKNIDWYCGHGWYLCPDCQKAREIYERILN